VRRCFTFCGACDSVGRAHLDYRTSEVSSERIVMNWDGSVPRREWGRPMTPEKSQNVQDVFLNHVRKNKTPVTIFLINGVKLQGIITWFDNFCVLLRRDAHSQLVYKHAISTVMPAQPIQLFEQNKEMAES
jgi:host factor-I protein